MKGLLVFVLTVLLAGCASPTTSPDTDDGSETPLLLPALPWTMTFTGCREMFFTSAIPAAGARAFVPPSFNIVGEAQGQASLSVGIAMCDGIGFDDLPAVPTSLSDVGVAIEAPNGSPGLHLYQAWRVANTSELVERSRGIGMVAERYNDTTLEPGTRLPLGAARAEASFNGSTYALEGTSVSPVTPIQFAVTWWTETADGPVGASYLFVGDSSVFQGAIVAKDGDMAALLGGERVEGTGFLPTFDGEGTVSIVG